MKKYSNFTPNQIKVALDAGDKIELGESYEYEIDVFLYEEVKNRTKDSEKGNIKILEENLYKIAENEKEFDIIIQKFDALTFNAIVSKRFMVGMFIAAEEDKDLRKLVEKAGVEFWANIKLREMHKPLIKEIKKEVLDIMDIDEAILKDHLGSDAIGLV